MQDDFADDGNPQTYDNIYQKIAYFEYKDSLWRQDLIIDHTKHPLASTRNRIVEQEDLFVENNGTIHILYKENTDPNDRFLTHHVHLSKKLGEEKWQEEKLNLPTIINCVRLFEVDNTLYFFANSWDSQYLARLNSQKLVKLPISGAIGIYPYVATKRGGTKDSPFIDILLLAADSETFKKETNFNYYLRIHKDDLAKLTSF
mgnify:FL=1